MHATRMKEGTIVVAIVQHWHKIQFKNCQQFIRALQPSLLNIIAIILTYS
jgi:hypothetical protein